MQNYINSSFQPFIHKVPLVHSYFKHSTPDFFISFLICFPPPLSVSLTKQSNSLRDVGPLYHLFCKQHNLENGNKLIQFIGGIYFHNAETWK